MNRSSKPKNKLLLPALCLALALGGALRSYGQVIPPDLLCVSNDTLIWAPPTDNCGPFNGYLVFGSQDLAGPYQLLGTVTDPDATFFYHDTPGASDWFYYLQTDADCPGEPVLSSDTLDTLVPVMAVIESVSVEDGDVRVSWLPSTSPEVVGYIISREVEGVGTIVLDTVYDLTTYLDTEANPGAREETYYIEAIDPCGNKSLVANPHTSILLQAMNAEDPCQRDISLSWNPYIGWDNGVAEYQIYEAGDTTAWELIGAVGGAELTFPFPSTTSGEEYCFSVVAVEAGGSNTARSNTVCVTAMINDPVDNLVMANTTVLDGAVEIEWHWNTNAIIESYTLQRASASSGFAGLITEPPPAPLPPENNYTDTGINPATGSYLYQVVTTDACGDQVTSNTAATIFLEAEALSNLSALQWTPYTNAAATLSGYTLYRIEGGAPVQVGTYGPTALTAEVEVDLSDPDQVRACYFVEAMAEADLGQGLSKSVTSRSNLACAAQQARVYIPNAFSPNGDGTNDTFTPYLQFGDPSSYQLLVYDRWGGQVFESNDLSTSWDGTQEGEPLNTGSYIFQLRVEQADGTLIERSGQIMLVR